MDPKDPLHLGALLCAVAAALWGLSTFLGATFFLAFLTGLAAGIVFLLRRPMDPRDRSRLRAAAIALITIHALFILLFLITTPINLGEDPEQGFNLDPPGWTLSALTFYSQALFALAALLLPAGIVLLSRMLERTLAAAGAILVIVVIILPLGTNDEMGIMMRILFMLGFFAIAAACILPPLRNDRQPWNNKEHETPPTR